jgi:hypothetical protein
MARTPCQCRGLAATDLQVRDSIGICVACARMDLVVQVHAAREQCAEPIRLSTPPMAMSSYRCITLRDYRARQTGHRIGPRSLGYKVQPRTDSVNCTFPRKHLSSQIVWAASPSRTAAIYRYWWKEGHHEHQCKAPVHPDIAPGKLNDRKAWMNRTMPSKVCKGTKFF